MIKLFVLISLVAFEDLFSGGTQGFDYSSLPYASRVIEAIRTNRPADFDKFLEREEIPSDMLGSILSASYYHKSQSDTASEILIIFYGGIKTGHLKAISLGHGSSSDVVIADLIVPCGDSYFSINYCDIDCDGINEIVLGSNAGVAAFRLATLVQFDGKEFHEIKSEQENQILFGRFIEIDSSGNKCPREIKLFVDGPKTYIPDTMKVFHFDKSNHSLRLNSIQPLQQEKK
jgi:hypothetical protein